jgi:hypothetical protein
VLGISHALEAKVLFGDGEWKVDGRQFLSGFYINEGCARLPKRLGFYLS